MAEMTFGAWLQRERKLLRLTQAQLAEQIGCSTVALRKIEAEERRPSAQILGRLAEILAIPSSDRAAFLRFARGDWQAAPASILTGPAWRVERAVPKSRLPAPLTSFVGREQDVATVLEYLANPTTRLVTLIGPPGIGKTRLSLQVATEAQQNLAAGVFFIPLAPITDANLVAQAIVQALGLVQTDQRSALERLKDGINDRQLLIVLDNFEQIAEGAAPLIPELLMACPRLKLLVTSRESLRVPGEWLYAVPPLLTPDDAQLKTRNPDAFDQFSALRLFAERARAVRANFVLTQENLPAVTAICRRLDGLPLAIELIAARIRLMSPQVLLARLTSDFLLHADGMRGVPSRQKTLHDAIAWSYNLLSPDEQALLMRLAVFAGGFTLEAAEAVTRMPDVIAGLTSLLDKSLVVRTLDANGEARFNLLVMIRDFGLNRLRAHNEESTLRDRHAAYFLDLAEQADREIRGPQQVEWIDRLEGEHDNYRSALEWCVSHQKTEEALRLISALGWTWLVRGHLSDGRSWFDRVTGLGNAANFPDAYGKGLIVFGLFGWYQGDYSYARGLLEQARTLYHALGTKGTSGLAQALDYLGLVVWWGDSDIEGAQNLFESAADLCRNCEDARGYAQTIHHLTGLRRSLKDQHARVLPLLKESLTIFSQLGDTWSVGWLYHNLCGLFTFQQDYARARLFAEQALANARLLDFKTGIATDLIDLGTICLAQGDDEEALRFYQASLDLSREYGMNVDEAIALFSQGLLALKQKDYGLANVALLESLTIFQSQGGSVNAAECLAGLAAVAAGAGQAEHAAQLMGWAQAVFDKIDYEMLPIVRIQIDQHIRLARDQLGSSAFEAWQAKGRAMTLKQAVEHAISYQTT